MERKEAYEQIKKLGLQEECKKKYGKNFTQCKTSELECIIDRFNSVKDGTKVKITEALTEPKPKHYFYKLLAILRKRHILLESDVKEILG